MKTLKGLLNQACTKRTINKAHAMSTALTKLRSICSQLDPSMVGPCKHIQLQLSHVPEHISHGLKFVALEFARVKYKVEADNGPLFLMKIESIGIMLILSQFSNINTLVICEEKYSFTPDMFKGPTRQNRQSASTISSISHLIPESQIISEKSFDKAAVRETVRGKKVASTYLAKHLDKLHLKKDLRLIVDSDLKVEGCAWSDKQNCKCPDKHSVTIHCFCSSEAGYVTGNKTDLAIKQRKGEGEMAIADWLLWHCLSGQLADNESIAAIVSSGDIDAVVITMFLVARHWPRFESGKFKNKVHVVLQKPNKLFDIYCISGIVEELESAYHTRDIALVVAVVLCIGGNDFLTGFRNRSHTKVLTIVLENEKLWKDLLVNDATVALRRDKFVLLVKYLYSSKKLDAATSEYQTIRHHTISAKRTKRKSSLGVLVNDPESWLPPLSAIERLAELVDFQLQYLLTTGYHNEQLPNIERCSCSVTLPNGSVAYDFGPDAHVTDINELTPSTELASQPQTSSRNKRSHVTPQKSRRKRPAHQSTPKQISRRH